MRRRRPWWAVLAASALVMASLLAPMEGAAYRITGDVDPVDRGDPEVPNDGPAPKPTDTLGLYRSIRTLFVIQVAPGVVIQIQMPIRAVNWTARTRKSIR